MSILYVNIRHERLSIRAQSAPYFLLFCYGERGTAKYAVNTPVIGSTALPVISPLLFMSFALASNAEKPAL